MNAIYSLISMGMLFFAVFSLYNQYRVDLLRNNLFEVRDRLFNEAARGSISFDSNAYMAVRMTINGMIRYGHRASLLRFITAAHILTPDNRDWANRQFMTKMQSSSSSDQEIACKYLMQANIAVMTHLVSSPFIVFMIPIIGFAFVKLKLSYISTWPETKLKKQFQRFDSDAYIEGCSPNRIMSDIAHA